jgi:hypothetical protein
MVRPSFIFPTSEPTFCFFFRLIDVAPKYFEPSSFPKGEMRSALERYIGAREDAKQVVTETTPKAVERESTIVGTGKES